jgi:hypothetical protein
MVGRAQETIAISADLKAHALPAIDAWLQLTELARRWRNVALHRHSG